MRSVCSEPALSRAPGWRRLLGLGPVAVVFALLLGDGARAADPRWQRGVFPVMNFAGYTSHFGSRIGPGGARELHSGLDIAAPMGSPIRSWWSGVVADAFHDGGCGVGLVVRSGDYDHMYCHLHGRVVDGRYTSGRVVLRVGQTVAAGQLIGHVGMSGRTTGPHLHWGIRYRGEWLDPGRILRAMVRARRTSPQNGTRSAGRWL